MRADPRPILFSFALFVATTTTSTSSPSSSSPRSFSPYLASACYAVEQMMLHFPGACFEAHIDDTVPTAIRCLLHRLAKGRIIFRSYYFDNEPVARSNGEVPQKTQGAGAGADMDEEDGKEKDKGSRRRSERTTLPRPPRVLKGTQWLLNAMRFRPLWEEESAVPVVVLDVHDDPRMQVIPPLVLG
jgi:hypothetical protein